uniref:Uncharacterized protein n=1 Tax=Pristionchus pacificus TaxID=54126 RepID=A0A2A6CGN7_PRIPA|eukprot:PDM77385.1 hypothetical protein PRIPAC_33115 [Pristionchus pacificus]
MAKGVALIPSPRKSTGSREEWDAGNLIAPPSSLAKLRGEGTRLSVTVPDHKARVLKHESK